MTIACIPVRRLGEWLSSTLDDRMAIRVSGGLRDPFRGLGGEVPALEFPGPNAATARVLIPAMPQFDSAGGPGAFPTAKPKGAGQKPGKPADTPERPSSTPIPASDAGSSPAAMAHAPVEEDAEKNWWSGWAALLTASTFLAPRVDPVRLADILRDRRRVRFFCDTNALALGVASWLVHLLPERAEIITSAIADKEVMNWIDNDKEAHRASTVKSWGTRLRFFLARRLTEAPPDGIVIDRLSPDQNALMLAQGTTRTGSKASDGDLLFVELARPLIREQPRQARVVFLTGDTNNARTATSALGPEHVLYANLDIERAKGSCARTVARGFWHPGGPLGTLTQAPAGEVLWNLLAAFSYLVVEQSGGVWVIEPAHSVRFGGPSDWADPWVDIHELKAPTKTVEIDPNAAVVDDQRTAAAEYTPPSPPGVATTPENVIVEQASPSVRPTTSPETRTAGEVAATPGPRQDMASQEPMAMPPKPAAAPATAISQDSDWLLPFVDPEGTRDTLSSSPRPNATRFIKFLQQVCFAGRTPIAVDDSELSRETLRVLAGLGAATDDGWPGPRAISFKAAWQKSDLDWIHAQLVLAHPGYRYAIDEIRKGRFEKLTSREEHFIPLARRLGQVARFPRTVSPPRVGDAPLTRKMLETAMLNWIPRREEAVRVMDVCEHAATDLQLTPFRFERAMVKLWDGVPDFPIEGRTGGEVEPGASEEVLDLHRDGTYGFRRVAPGALRFDRSTPILFLVRTR